jgi:hypothetical protein
VRPVEGNPSNCALEPLGRRADRRRRIRPRSAQAVAVADSARSRFARAPLRPPHRLASEPAHFVERHGLIVIIAIGESLAAIGFGARETRLDAGVIVAALLGLVVAASFWLAYFDFFTIRAQGLLAERSGIARVAFARDVYTYLHLPMVAGIVLFAFAMKTTLAHVGAELAAVPALALCGGACALPVRVRRAPLSRLALGEKRPPGRCGCVPPSLRRPAPGRARRRLAAARPPVRRG